MRIVIYPGTFDPIHCGHLDIAERAAALFDKLIFAVAVNAEKNPLFSPKERIEMIIESMAKEFPEFVLALAEENWIRGYQQALSDVTEAKSSIERSWRRAISREPS